MQSLLAQRDAAVANGARLVGWKIGFNTAPIQRHFGLTEPVVGYLLDRAVHSDGATVSLDGWSAPAVEVEVAVRVGPLEEGGPPTIVGLAPALELVDLGIPFDDIELVLADNICQRGVVFGEDLSGVDPFAIGVTATKNGQPAGDGPLVEAPCRDRRLRAGLPPDSRGRPGTRPAHNRRVTDSAHRSGPGRRPARRVRPTRHVVSQLLLRQDTGVSAPSDPGAFAIAYEILARSSVTLSRS